jgi:hypothetical protein
MFMRSGVDLDDARAHRLVDEVGDVVRAAQVDLARGQEHVDALDVDQEAALDLALARCPGSRRLVVLLETRSHERRRSARRFEMLRRVVVVEAFVEDLVVLALLRQDLAELGDRDLTLDLPPMSMTTMPVRSSTESTRARTIDPGRTSLTDSERRSVSCAS